MRPIARREFLKGSVLAGGAWALGGCASLPDVGSTYPGWRPGELDIHFIHTGVGG